MAKKNNNWWIVGIIIAIILLILFGSVCMDSLEGMPDEDDGGTGSGVTTTTISTPCGNTYPTCNGRCIKPGDICVKYPGYCQCESPNQTTTTTTLIPKPCSEIRPSRPDDCYSGICEGTNKECAYNPFDNICFCQDKYDCGYHVRNGREYCDGGCDDPEKSCLDVYYPDYGFYWCDCYYPDEIQQPCEQIDNPSVVSCLNGYCPTGDCRFKDDIGECDCVQLCDDTSPFMPGGCSMGWCPTGQTCSYQLRLECGCTSLTTTTSSTSTTSTTTSTTTTTTIIQCYDSDGINYYTLGYRESPLGSNRVWDHCNNVNPTYLYEMKCTGATPGYDYVACAYGCENGVCRTSATTTTTPVTTTTLPSCISLCTGYDVTYHGSVGTTKCSDWGMPYCSSGVCKYQCIYKGIDRDGLNCYCWNQETCNCNVPNNCDNSGCKDLEGICTDSDNGVSYSGSPGTCTDDYGVHKDYCYSFTAKTGYYCSSGSGNPGHCVSSSNVCWSGQAPGDVPVCNTDTDYCYSVTPSTCNNMCQEAGAIYAYGTYGVCGAFPTSGGIDDPYYFDITGTSDCIGGNPYCHCRKPSGYT
jgi:hypothetical protein